MITVTGRTFDHRDLLKSMGGRWNNADRNWQFASMTQAQIARLAIIPGVFVTGTPTPARVATWLSWNEPEQPTVRPPTQMFGNDPSFFNYFEDQDPTAFFGFSSLRAFADYVASLKRASDDDQHRSAVGWKDDDQYIAFAGTDNMAHALDLARNGWMDGMGITGKLAVDGAQSKRRYASMAGGTVNVGRMLSGDPRHMVKRTRQPGHRNIRLFVQTIMWRGIGASIAVYRALIIAGMVDLLEREGYRCEVIAVANTLHSHDHTPQSQLAVRIKEAHERLNLLDITFALGHPSFSRRMFFAAKGCVPECHVTDDNRGLISAAFSDDHPNAPNEFYIPQIFGLSAKQLTNDPMSILPFITPANLPIKIKGIQ